MKIDTLNSQENLLTYLSETLNGCLTLSETLQNNQKGDFHIILVGISELFSLYQSTKLYYLLNEKGEKDTDVLDFFTNFDEFYSEVKHYYLYDTKIFKKDFSNVSARKEDLVANYEKILVKLQNFGEENK
ncbi:MAG: hypothetical protein LBV67_00595 [Streptococcaceae bacterium]|jgi:hypothetical protein|nr:hypothetical protein [Streptococcaceae bacterium]